MTGNRKKPHWTHWAISGLLLLWNALGSVNFAFQFDATYVASLPDPYQTIIATRPAWATAAFGLAVIGGVVGAIFLMRRSRFAVPVLALSALGAALATLQAFTWGGVMQIATAMAAAIYARLSSRQDYPG